MNDIEEETWFKIVEPHVEILAIPDADEALRLIETAGRTCYHSEHLMTEDSARGFVQRRLYDDHHESLLEHASLTAKFVCDRGVADEIARHRMASFCMQSTRYCNFTKDTFDGQLSFIQPPVAKGQSLSEWLDVCELASRTYKAMIERGESPQMARSVLPLSLATELVMTANFREWRHFFKLRTAQAAHPQLRELALDLLDQCRKKIPIVFDEI